VLEVRALAEPSWQSERFEVEFQFILPDELMPRYPNDMPHTAELDEVVTWVKKKKRTSTELALEIEKRTDPRAISVLWDDLVHAWVALVVPDGPFSAATARAYNEREYSFWDYRRSSALDLEYLSVE
jgi:hypothetical protein